MLPHSQERRGTLRPYVPSKRRQISVRLLGVKSHMTAILFACMFVQHYAFEFGLRQGYTYAISNITPHHEETFLNSTADRDKWPVRRPGCYTPWKENPDTLFSKTQRGDDNSIIVSDANHSLISQP